MKGKKKRARHPMKVLTIKKLNEKRVKKPIQMHVAKIRNKLMHIETHENKLSIEKSLLRHKCWQTSEQN
jgi:hypothetical protein